MVCSSKNVKDLAKLVLKEKGRLVQSTPECYQYTHKDKSCDFIDVSTLTCTCSMFLDKALCKHLITVCLKNSWSHFGLKPKGSTKVFSVRYSRYKKKGLEDSDNEDNGYRAPEDIPEEEEEHVSSATVVKRGRGRPKLATPALEHEFPQEKKKTKANKPPKKSIITLRTKNN